METLETLNQHLIDEFGIDSSTGQPQFRIRWANDETEMRLMHETDTGVRLLFPEVREVKKYPYLRDLYVLERLVIVPEINQDELPASKLSYEPVWAYCDEARNMVYPQWDATKFVVDTIYAALGKKSLRKYIEDEKDTTVEGREERIMELQEDLFGNETDVGDALAHREGIIVPNNFKKES